MLRDAVAARTALGRAVAATMHGGGLVSDETMIALVRERLARVVAAALGAAFGADAAAAGRLVQRTR